MSGQTLTDRIAAAQYQLTGSDMARAVCKATTHEVMAPKKKHLECKCSPSSSFILPGVSHNTTNVNIPQMADTLFERATNASWVSSSRPSSPAITCVSTATRFIQYLASRTSLFNLSNFIDKTGSHESRRGTLIMVVRELVVIGLSFSCLHFVCLHYELYPIAVVIPGVMRTMTTEKLLKGMPVLQTQIDTLLEFDIHPKELNNGIINGAFLLLFKDLVKLFASYNDGVINLLGP
ncbi:hypothetical protein F7725_019464 [Dissostichus mawsoni]|uniref:AP180 N-terminal homology (ANTH) domain-containing protein n=1 Tax=Dissostichus mawsoni TaxID=36200 RepID=A0A7J5YJW0_DISMA|nr:hypothetical protein F7725_019464 [Dissostichus mawsoni]